MIPTSRRRFLKASGAAVAATCVGARQLSAAPLRFPVGLQLYSVRDLLPKDFDGTLARVRAAGYTEVEAAGYYDKPAAEFRKAMGAAGLRCISTHHPMVVLKPRLDELIEYGHALGLNYMVCPSPMRKDPAAKGPLTLDDWRWTADELNKIGEKVNAAGMRFGYHNHTLNSAAKAESFSTTSCFALPIPNGCSLRWTAAGWLQPDATGGLPEQNAGAVSDAAREGHGQGRKRRDALNGDGPRRDRLQADSARGDRAQALLHRAGRVRYRSIEALNWMRSTCASWMYKPFPSHGARKVRPPVAFRVGFGYEHIRREADGAGAARVHDGRGAGQAGGGSGPADGFADYGGQHGSTARRAAIRQSRRWICRRCWPA